MLKVEETRIRPYANSLNVLLQEWNSNKVIDDYEVDI